MMPFSLLVLLLLALLVVIVLIQRGGMIDSLRSLELKGSKLVIGLLTLGAVGAVFYRSMAYLTPEREGWITRGVTPADSVSSGFDTKARFRSLAQPLGRITDRNGVTLAGYELRDGHLARIYPAGEATAHIVGYWTGPLRDGVGVEKALTLVNDSLRDDKPHDVQLTLDLRLQRDALRALGGKMGAVVVVDPLTGEVLAAANYPTYDPNRVTNDTVWKRLVTDLKLRPLTSRAIKDNFSPGSSIKPFVAAAALTLGTSLPEERGFSCNGAYTPGSSIKPITDHGSSHGGVDLARAMRVSCNVYFSYLAYELITFGSISSYFDSLGFNSRMNWNTGIFLNQYNTLLPATSWVRARDEIARTRIGIGQASTKTNPLHMTMMVAGIANGGVFLRPTLETGRPLDTMNWDLTPEAAAQVQDLLREPLLPGGTAAGAFPGFDARGITVYGKTGTADREPDGREPSWFISYAEKNGRRYAVCVAIQDRNGQYAGSLNAPIARRVYESLDSYGYFVPAVTPREPAAQTSRRGGTR